MSFETISVIGLGYIGLPTAAMFASKQKKVIGVDLNQKVINTINRGEIHIVEPDLDKIVHAAVSDGYLRATSSVEPADAFLIAVPTPFKESNSEIPEPDLSYIEDAAKSIAPVLKKGDLVILESTSPVGTTEQMTKWLATCRPDLNFPQTSDKSVDVNVAYCPERVLPGRVVCELVENDRVIGGMTTSCSNRAIELYKIFLKGECVITSARTAEMAKLTENSCRDVQIAFANELSVICEDLDINVWELIELANRHPRVNILQPGPGVGGHCIAVDPWFIVNKSPEDAKIIHMARMINDHKTDWVIEKVKLTVNDLLSSESARLISDITIALYGLTFKPNIDDLRESPALKVAEAVCSNLTTRNLIVEPNISDLPDSFHRGELVSLADASGADIHVLLVQHDVFQDAKVLNSMRGRVLDFCGLVK